MKENLLSRREYMFEYYTLNFNNNRYLFGVPLNHPGYITTDNPDEAMKWKSKEKAEEFLVQFEAKNFCHIQKIFTNEEPKYWKNIVG